MKARIIYVPLIRKYIPQVYDKRFNCWEGVEVPSWYRTGEHRTWYSYQTKYCTHKNLGSAMKALKQYLDFELSKKTRAQMEDSLSKQDELYFEVVEEFNSGEDNSSKES